MIAGGSEEGATAKSKIKVCLDQCHYCKITSEGVRGMEREKRGYVAYIKHRRRQHNATELPPACRLSAWPAGALYINKTL